MSNVINADPSSGMQHTPKHRSGLNIQVLAVILNYKLIVCLFLKENWQCQDF